MGVRSVCDSQLFSSHRVFAAHICHDNDTNASASGGGGGGGALA